MPVTRSLAKQGIEQLVEINQEIERSARKERREQRQAEKSEPQNIITMADQQIQQQQIQEEPRIRLKDRALPKAHDFRSSISGPAVETQNFELKPALIQMIQQSQFGGGMNENPNVHITKFLQLCNTLKMNGVPDEAIRMRLFPFSLRDRASEWLMSMPPNSFTTWEDLSSAFLAKYFPPSKTAKIRNEIINFTQRDGESLYEAWERLKDLQRQCPHHGVPTWMVIENFYNGLEQAVRSSIDSTAGGSLMSKTDDEAYELIEEMAQHNYQYGNLRGNMKRASLNEIDAFANLAAQVNLISKKLDKMQVKGMEKVEAREAWESQRLI